MEHLKTLRRECGKTQQEIAKYLEMSQSSYQSYEAGDTEPNIDKLIKLADYYQVSIDYLVGRNFTNDVYLTEVESTFLDTFRALNQDNQKMLFAEAKGMLIAQNI